jgi:hypothetical protein
MTNEDLGHLGLPSGERCEYLALSFSPLSAPLRSRWRNNGVSADFIGDYVTTFLPAEGDNGDGHANRREIRHAVTYIANEFLENAMKYHQRDMDIPIGIRLELTSDQITISTSNAVTNDQASCYRDFALRILSEDAGELLVKQLEAGSLGDSSGSCTGLLTMITDYGAKLGWRFEGHAGQEDQITVTTSAELSLGELSGVKA